MEGKNGTQRLRVLYISDDDSFGGLEGFLLTIARRCPRLEEVIATTYRRMSIRIKRMEGEAKIYSCRGL